MTDLISEIETNVLNIAELLNDARSDLHRLVRLRFACESQYRAIENIADEEQYRHLRRRLWTCQAALNRLIEAADFALRQKGWEC
ncbi:MAG: hypothetical protein KA383_12400 [Phycisphaerae bacterium]|nr:hypothetical protein [Phycisphaerae bacterium]